MKIYLLCAIGLTLSACSSLPTAGPTTRDVLAQSEANGQMRFSVVDVNDRVISILNARPQETFHSRFENFGAPPQPTISVGDTVAVTIWEAGGGLFNSSTTGDHGNDGKAIPPQVVQADGAITIPFAGRIKVVGRTAAGVEEDIRRRLDGKAVDPQVIASVVKSTYYSASVSGEVVNGSRVPLSPQGDRILDVIAAAGGARVPIYETFVTLTRAGVTASIPLKTMIDTPAEDILVWPGDVLTLTRRQRAFDAFGATGKNAEISFDLENLSVAQALAKASGLLDERADPAGVFLLRMEPSSLIRQFPNVTPPTAADGDVPVVYHFDFSDATAYFFAQRFVVANNDIVYVANAQSNSIQKFFQLLSTLTGPIITGFIVKNSL